MESTFRLRVLGFTLFEAHLTDESSRLVTETLARRDRWIRYVFEEQGPKPITQTMLLAQICGQANVQDRCQGPDLPLRWELLPRSWISGGRTGMNPSIFHANRNLKLFQTWLNGCDRSPRGRLRPAPATSSCSGRMFLWEPSANKRSKPDEGFVYLVVLETS